MNKTLRTLAVQFALVAMLLRALVPAGWMPAVSQDALLVVCTAQGLQTVAIGTQKPVDHAPSRAHDVCPFAAAANPTTPQLGAEVPAPTLIASAITPQEYKDAHRAPAQFHPHSPRAPPATA